MSLDKHQFLTENEATALLPLVIRADYRPNHGADLQFLLSDGRHLDYWAASDYGDAYWWLYPAGAAKR